MRPIFLLPIHPTRPPQLSFRRPPSPEGRVLKRAKRLQRSFRVLLTAAMATAASLALLAVSAAHSWAEEGFFIADKPPAVQRLWSSVYAFVCEGRKDAYTATAFLVAKIDKDPPGTRRRMMADYYFVTAGHAIAACKRRKRYLAENLNEPEFEEDGITVRRRAARFSGAESVYVDDTYDLAVVKVTAAADAKVGRPVKVGDSCDRALKREVYAIGFPGVENRRSLKMKRETKRWSRGVFVGLGKADFQDVEAIYFAATVDSLPGSSGSESTVPAKYMASPSSHSALPTPTTPPRLQRLVSPLLSRQRRFSPPVTPIA